MKVIYILWIYVHYFSEGNKVILKDDSFICVLEILYSLALYWLALVYPGA